jgi:hypothetical protein
MNYARVINGEIVAYPYALRPTAKRAHPEVSPLPGSWEQCTPEQLQALECVWVHDVARPSLQAGESCAEGTPEYVGGQWRQTWIVTPAPEPGVPDEVDSLAFELTLHSLGLHAAVMTYVDTLPAVEQIYWRRRQTMRRDSTLIESGRVALGLTAEQVDALFMAAGQVVT